MSIASEISRLQSAKASIKEAIEAKGVTVLSSLKLDGYASCISQISGGGGGQVVIPDGMHFASSTFSKLPQFLQDADWSEVSSMFFGFAYCSRLTSIALSNLSNITSMGYCFSGCTSLTSVSIPGFSNVSDMGYCFAGCSLMSSLTLPALSNVSRMDYCFSNCSALTSITLSGLSKVTTMSNCFTNCSALTSITLSGLSKVTNMSNCFRNCSELQNLVVDSWGTSITNLANWYISSCTKLTHDSLINLISALYTTSVSRTCTIGTTNLNKLTADEKAVATAKGWNLN